MNVSYADSMLALKCLLANVDSRPPAEHDDEHSSTLRELEQTIAGHQTAIDNVKAAIATTVDPSTIGALTATLTGSIAAKSQAQAKLQAYQVEHKAKLSVNERISAYADIMHDIDSSVGSPEIANRVNARLRQLGLTVLVDRQEFRLMENGSPIGSLSSTQIAALKEADKEIKAVQVERLAIAR
ncbi:hypothetical protein [Endozoicomonas sp. 4G]|uniref:hypothetical protein n=1 Tax=Endozoicomonas sp. 4G TaxID=2872754 RepID=UPI0020791672|nr:hypothetical protein [Endozoicomonas sp. 4G]